VKHPHYHYGRSAYRLLYTYLRRVSESHIASRYPVGSQAIASTTVEEIPTRTPAISLPLRLLLSSRQSSSSRLDLPDLRTCNAPTAFPIDESVHAFRQPFIASSYDILRVLKSSLLWVCIARILQAEVVGTLVLGRLLLLACVGYMLVWKSRRRRMRCKVP
jgi:hypothetical protein